MAEKLNLDYYYGRQAEQFSFIPIPRVLITEPCYVGLSMDAKYLYAIMLDRLKLSVKNGYLDDDGKTFMYCSVEDAASQLNCGPEKGCTIETVA